MGSLSRLAYKYQVVISEGRLPDQGGGPPLMRDPAGQGCFGFKHAVARRWVLETTSKYPEEQAIHRTAGVAAFGGGKVKKPELGMLHQGV